VDEEEQRQQTAMRTFIAITALLSLAAALGDIDRTFWKSPEEIDSSGSKEYVAQHGSAAQQRSLEVYRNEIAACDKLPPEKAIPILADAVFKLTRLNIYQLRERIEVFDLARDKLLFLPGHAQYFADLIEEERAKLKPGDFRVAYDENRYRYLRETLGHVPSPETVKVLGHYLDDERDIPPPPKPNQDYGDMPANAIIAMESLLCLELRDAPYPPGRYLDSNKTPTVLAAVREWFAPIKSGQRTFSFRGQAVEYRFNPDGTWVSNPIANPPDDAPKPPITSSPEKSPAVAAAQSHQPALWPWLGGVLLVLLGILIWQIKARCARKSP
jgi:hypothetical protein